MKRLWNAGTAKGAHATEHEAATVPLRKSAASWPGRPHRNLFVEEFVRMLEEHGWEVISVRGTRWLDAVSDCPIFIIHWAEMPFWGALASSWRKSLRAFRILVYLVRLRCGGTRLVWLVHNTHPHDHKQHRWIWRVYGAILTRLVDGWMTLAPGTRGTVCAAWPSLRRKPRTYIWHPPYPSIRPVEKAAARRELGLSTTDTLFAHVGMVRRYKAIESAVSGFARWNVRGTKFFICGELSDETYGNELADQIRDIAAAEVLFGRLTYDHFEAWLDAIDVFVAPYARTLHSGAVVHALCRGCVVLARRHVFMKDLQEAIGADWIVLYDDAPESSDFEQAREYAVSHGDRLPNLTALEPANNSARLDAFLRTLVAGTSRKNVEWW